MADGGGGYGAYGYGYGPGGQSYTDIYGSYPGGGSGPDAISAADTAAALSGLGSGLGQDVISNALASFAGPAGNVLLGDTSGQNLNDFAGALAETLGISESDALNAIQNLGAGPGMSIDPTGGLGTTPNAGPAGSTPSAPGAGDTVTPGPAGSPAGGGILGGGGGGSAGLGTGGFGAGGSASGGNAVSAAAQSGGGYGGGGGGGGGAGNLGNINRATTDALANTVDQLAGIGKIQQLLQEGVPPSQIQAQAGLLNAQWGLTPDQINSIISTVQSGLGQIGSTLFPGGTPTLQGPPAPGQIVGPGGITIGSPGTIAGRTPTGIAGATSQAPEVPGLGTAVGSLPSRTESRPGLTPGNPLAGPGFGPIPNAGPPTGGLIGRPGGLPSLENIANSAAGYTQDTLTPQEQAMPTIQELLQREAQRLAAAGLSGRTVPFPGATSLGALGVTTPNMRDIVPGPGPGIGSVTSEGLPSLPTPAGAPPGPAPGAATMTSLAQMLAAMTQGVPFPDVTGITSLPPSDITPGPGPGITPVTSQPLPSLGGPSPRPGVPPTSPIGPTQAPGPGAQPGTVPAPAPSPAPGVPGGYRPTGGTPLPPTALAGIQPRPGV
jgi:hypothetical protein